MSTTDVYVEQLIVGGIVVAILFVLVTGALPDVSKPDRGVVFAAIAYLAGLLYDRVGDTLLDRIERRGRLLFAKKKGGFKEDELRMKALKDSDAVAAQYQYLRSRIRLTRALATLAPAITIAFLANEAVAGPGLAAAVVAAYVVAGVGSSFMPELPRTEEVSEYKGSVWDAWAPALVGLALLAGVACRTAAHPGVKYGWWIVAAGLGLTLVAGWSWLRISKTFREWVHGV